MYYIGKWQDLDNFSCTDCPYETLEEVLIQDHVLFIHDQVALEPIGPLPEPPLEPDEGLDGAEADGQPSATAAKVEQPAHGGANAR